MKLLQGRGTQVVGVKRLKKRFKIFIWCNVIAFLLVPRAFYGFYGVVGAIGGNVLESRKHYAVTKKYGRTVADLRLLGSKDSWGWVSDIADWHK